MTMNIIQELDDHLETIICGEYFREDVALAWVKLLADALWSNKPVTRAIDYGFDFDRDADPSEVKQALLDLIEVIYAKHA